MDRCRREIAAVEAQLRAGHPDLEGLCLALADWSAELRLLEQERGPKQQGPPGQMPGGPGVSNANP
jgi:hypothetical protein